MPYDTLWSREYDERTLECTAARIAASLEPSPREWPISGPLAKTFNPGGNPLSGDNETADATATPTR